MNRATGGAALRNRLVAAILFAVGFAASDPALALTARDTALYRQSFALAAKDRHDDALRLAEGADDSGPAKVLLWMKLAAPYGGGFAEVTAFIKANPDWPGLAGLKRQVEKSIAESLDESQMVAWFDANPPITADGLMFYADALLRTGATDKASRVIRDAWTGFSFSQSEEQTFLARYGEQLRKRDHQARLDRLLWERNGAAAQRLRDLVGSDYAALLDARLALGDATAQALTAYERVPGSLRDDPGLLFDLARYKRRNDDTTGAAEILKSVPYARDRDDKWWGERNLVARRLLDSGDSALAYQVVARHRPKDGTGNADADFLAGWIALRLGRTEDAFRHFQDVGRESTSPITRARSAYWSGRAAEASGDGAAADWYRKAAAYSTTFYGLLAADRAGGPARPLPPSPGIGPGDAHGFERKELVRIARALRGILGRDDPRVALFLRAAGQTAKTAGEYRMAARLANELGFPEIAIAVAKNAVREDIYLIDEGYPTIKLAVRSPEPALIHAIIRQESTFNPGIVSSVGARGLMQLMPATARSIAGKLKIKHTDAKLTTDSAYNVKLGAAYLDEMIQRFDGSYILAAAAYNAGPSRVAEWIGLHGDPRVPGVDPVDWIEQIPFSETRNYVQRIMEALAVYRQRLGDRKPASFEAELQR